MTGRGSVNSAYGDGLGQGDDEINWLELWQTLVKYQRLILGATFGAALLAAGISLLLPNIYRAEIVLAPSAKADDKQGGFGMALGSLGGLASLAGVSLAGGGSNEESLAVLKSRDFIWKFVSEKKLMPVLFEDEWDQTANRWKKTDPKKQPGQMDVYRLFKDSLMTVEVDKKTSLVTVTLEWKDAKLAAEWANAMVDYLNEYLAQRAIKRSESNLKYLNEALMSTQIEEARKVLFDLIAQDTKNAMLANAQKEFAFKVLDPAVEPDKKIKPKRSIIVLLTALLAGFLSILYVFIKERSIKSRKEQLPESPKI